jgi:AcrR family transcriptional regulator
LLTWELSVGDGPNVEDARRVVGGGGRRLDTSRDSAILRAALEALAECGYDRLTMDDVAARAHAGKGALYRRWPSKAALVVDAVVAWRQEFAPLSIPDTGSLRGDVEAVIANVPTTDVGQVALIVGLATAASRDPELRAALSEHVLQRPRRAIREMLDRAVERGEIPRDRVLDLVPDVIIGLNALRVLTGADADRAFFRRVFDEVVYPLVTGPCSTPPS